VVRDVGCRRSDLARKKKIDEKIEARIKELEDELMSLKADYIGTAIDELRRPKGPFSVVTFRAGDKVFALPLWSVKAISRAVTVADKGELGAGFTGVINYHGELVPVLDVAALGVEGRDMDAGDHVIYFSAGGRRVAMVVSAVLDVEILDCEKIVSAGDAGLPRRPFLGVYERQGNLTRVLEPSALLPDVAAAREVGERDVVPEISFEPEADESVE
jgi:chemotaxis signal transduction protein